MNNHKFLILLVLILANFWCAGQEIEKSKGCEFREPCFPVHGNARRNEISCSQLKTDIEYFCYYLETAYAGYEKMEENGFCAEQFADFFLEKYAGFDFIDTKKLMNEYLEYMKKSVADGHFSISMESGGNANYVAPKNKILFADTFLEERNGKYYVYKTDSEFLKADDEFTDSTEKLFFYPAKGKNIYRLGVFSASKTEAAEFSFNNRTVKIPLFDDGNISADFRLKYHEIETEKSGYASISSFLLPEKNSARRKGSEIIFKKFVSLSERWFSKENIIIDLRSNNGGEINYIEAFLYFLYFGNYNDFNEKQAKKIDDFFEANIFTKTIFDSPAINFAKLNFLNEYKVPNSKEHIKTAKQRLKKHKKNPQVKQWKQSANNLIEEKPKFRGKLIFLIDRNSVSAAELFVLSAKLLFGQENALAIGENSYGSLDYGEIYNYLLPESGIAVSLASERMDFAKELSQWHGDGLGIFPDYWSTGEDLNETIFLATKDEAMKEKLGKIGERVL